MKNLIFLLFLVFIFFLNSCASLKMDPTFEKSANKYQISHPSALFSYEPLTFTLEDSRTNDIYEMKVEWSKGTMASGIINEDEIRRGETDEIIDYTQSFTTAIISNPINDKNYEIIGTTTTFRSLKQSETSTRETSTRSWPIELSIFEQGKIVGKIIENENPFDSQRDIFLNDRHISWNWGSLFLRKRTVALKFENEIIAFFDLDPTSSSATEFKGNAYLKPGLTEDFIADIFTSYIITDIMLGVIKWSH